jgi:hypothetical protein
MSAWVKRGHRSTSDQCLLYPRRRTLELGREALDLWAAQLMKLVTAQPKPKAVPRSR